MELDTLSDGDSQEEADSPERGREGLESGGGPSFEAQEVSEAPSIQEWEVDQSQKNRPEDEGDCEVLSRRVASAQQPSPAGQQPEQIAEVSSPPGEAGDPHVRHICRSCTLTMLIFSCTYRSDSSSQSEPPAQAEPEPEAQWAQEPGQPGPVQVPPWASPEPVRTPEGLQGPEDAPIWHRTRARNPLKDVSIEELEAMLQEDFLESDHDDDEAYQEFLRVKSHDLPLSTESCQVLTGGCPSHPVGMHGQNQSQISI